MTSRRIAIAGLGTIGRTVARKLADGLPGLALSAIAARDDARATGHGWTGRITALSVIAALRKLTAPLRIGT